MSKLVLAIDQGTTGSTVVLLDESLRILGKATEEYPQIFPKPGWVEHNPDDIWQSVLTALQKLFARIGGGVNVKNIAAIGITNQRETTILWEKSGGRPIHNAIVWQCRRTAEDCAVLKRKGYEPLFRRKTGLVLDAYFSGTKIAWLLKNVPGARERAKRGELLFGTVDSYLVYRLTGGAAHVTDVSNASRTLLFNLKTLDWDDQLLKILQIPRGILPRSASNAEIYGFTRNVPGLPDGIPIAGMAGDQQAALFGQACFQTGQAKCTYGTGAFLLINTGKKCVASKRGMLTTVAWMLGDQVSYALEGSTFIAGAAIQWLRDGLKIIDSSAQSEDMALSVPDTGGVTFVPAFVGLGAPHWDPHARGIITGITRGTTSAHVVRAALEGIAFQIADLIAAMEGDFGKKISVLRVDGGAAANNLLMQFQANILNRNLVRPKQIETTALGAAFLAGLGAGIWKDTQSITASWQEDQKFSPHMKNTERLKRLAQWRAAVKKA